MLTVLPDTAGDFICVQASETLTADDYKTVLAPMIGEKVKQFGPIRMVIYLDGTFSGWEIGAIWEDAKLGFEHANDFVRIALVGDSDWLDWAAKLANHLSQGEAQHFEPNQFLQALHWVNDGEV
jgi:hypothetical protein